MSTSDESKADPDLPDDTSEASPIFGALMVLWFSAFSVGALYFAITKYLAGWPLLSMPVLGFGGGGAVAMLIAAGVTAKKVTWSAPTLPRDAPWELRPAWQSPTIREDLYFRTFSPAVAALLVAFSWGIAGVVLYSTWTSGNSYFWILFGLAFLVGGGAPGISTLRRLRHRWKYGTSTLVMDTMPGRLGRTLEARLQTSVTPSDAHGDAFHARLTCYERTSGDDSTSWFQKWQTETDVTDYFASPSQSGATASDRVEVPISFELPDNAPPSTPEKKSNRIAWILEVSAEMEGLDYESHFEIPVFEPERGGTPEPSPAEEPPASQDPGPSESPGAIASDEPASPDDPRSSEGLESDTSELNVSSESDPDDLSEDYFENDSYRKNTSDRTVDEDEGDGEMARCDNCRSAVKASASECPACGADLDSGWFS